MLARAGGTADAAGAAQICDELQIPIEVIVNQAHFVYQQFWLIEQTKAILNTDSIRSLYWIARTFSSIWWGKNYLDTKHLPA